MAFPLQETLDKCSQIKKREELPCKKSEKVTEWESQKALIAENNNGFLFPLVLPPEPEQKHWLKGELGTSETEYGMAIWS